jgi:hypothetical protein
MFVPVANHDLKILPLMNKVPKEFLIPVKAAA